MIVAGYWPIKSEIDPVPLMAALADAGYQTALPSTPKPGEPLVFHLWQPGMLLWMVFTARRAAVIGTGLPADCLLVPMLAFDAAFFRLGYGGGFYDRSLESIRKDKPE